MGVVSDQFQTEWNNDFLLFWYNLKLYLPFLQPHHTAGSDSICRQLQLSSIMFWNSFPFPFPAAANIGRAEMENSEYYSWGSLPAATTYSATDQKYDGAEQRGLRPILVVAASHNIPKVTGSQLG